MQDHHRRHPINYALFRQRALQEREAYLRDALSTSLPSISPKTKRRVGVIATAFAVATGAFWATMLTSPPTTEASNPTLSVFDLQTKVPLNLPGSVFDAH